MKRICKKCGLEKPLEDFVVNKRLPSGHENKCKTCNSKASSQWSLDHREYKTVRARQYRFEHPEKYYPKLKEYCQTPGFKKIASEYQKKYEKQHPDRKAAHIAVWRALKKGVLIKPDTCPACGKTGQIEAHHNDYSKKLEVEWFCSSCHKIKHYELKIQGGQSHEQIRIHC